MTNFHGSLGNPSKDRQRFVEAIVLIDWSKTLLNFTNVVQTPFESAFEPQTMLDFAKLHGKNFQSTSNNLIYAKIIVSKLNS